MTTRGRLCLIVACALAGACAGTPEKQSADAPTGQPSTTRSPADPWEPLNRPIYAFNRTFDSLTYKPIAKVYEFVFPELIRQGVTNFSRNLRTPLVMINNGLQGKGSDAANDLGRFLLNSTLGLGGILDPATDVGLDRHDEDFGQTFAVWGVPAGPFVSVPLLGPNTLRDALLIPLNFYADPLLHLDNSSVRDKLYGLRAIDLRQRLFAAEELIKDSPDRYLTLRESFLQRRRYLIFDGNPPVDDDFYEDFYDDFDDEFLEEEEP